MKRVIAVIGGRRVKRGLLTVAEEVGRLIAERGAVLMCGGLGGIMEAAAKGAKHAGGLTLGILPQDDKESANPYIDVPVATGLGIGRNVIIARTADAVVAIGGQYGTLSEIAFSLQLKKTVVGIQTWDIDGVLMAETPEEAVVKIFDGLTGSS